VRPAIDRDLSDVARRVEAPELYLRFTLSYRDVEKLLAERGLARRTAAIGRISAFRDWIESRLTTRLRDFMNGAYAALTETTKRRRNTT
jgi:hypothetical protein